MIAWLLIVSIKFFLKNLYSKCFSHGLKVAYELQVPPEGYKQFDVSAALEKSMMSKLLNIIISMKLMAITMEFIEGLLEKLELPSCPLIMKFTGAFQNLMK